MSPKLMPTNSSNRSPANSAVSRIARSRSTQSSRRVLDALSESRQASKALASAAAVPWTEFRRSSDGPPSPSGWPRSTPRCRDTHRVFQVDQHRRTDAAAWELANNANAVRSASRLMSSRRSAATSVPPTTISATPSKSLQYAARVWADSFRLRGRPGTPRTTPAYPLGGAHTDFSVGAR